MFVPFKQIRHTDLISKLTKLTKLSKIIPMDIHIYTVFAAILGLIDLKKRCLKNYIFYRNKIYTTVKHL